MNKTFSYAFFGTGPLAESVLASLVREGHTPKLIVTKPDSKQGRHLELAAPHIKVWAEMKGIDIFQPESLKELGETSPLLSQKFDLFIVASYGKIIPKNILAHATCGTLNVHPSLLPFYRGPSPIESALLDGAESLGVSIMKLDEEVDHGPILAQSVLMLEKEDTAGTLEMRAGILGGKLLSQILPHFLDGTLIPKEQDHSKATFCKKIGKEMGKLFLNESANDLQKKWRALNPWPGIYFFHKHGDKNIRIKVSKINFTLGSDVTAKDCILKVIPEGKKEMSFEDFKRGYINIA